MGILDDAIRQHLDLKRQRGATESELKELEDEAFGPPTRPGEPDFPESEEAHEQSGNGVAGDLPVADPQPSDAADPAEEATSMLEPPVGEHQVLESRAEGEEEEPAEAGSEPEPGANRESEELRALYDQTADRDELALEDLGEEPASEVEDEGPQPVESLETVEHSLPAEEDEEPPEEAPEPEAEVAPAVEEDEEPPLEEEAASEEEAPSEEEPPEQEPAGDDDDVLADTPEFLKDAPEDDELWFEQGKPKDFDF
jgi:hypothetical protein